MQSRNFSAQEIREVALKEHNKYRKFHGVPEVQGSKQMHETAQQWADYLATTNRFEPTTLAKYGASIGSSFKDTEIEAVRDAIKSWYEGHKQYDYENPVVKKETGAFASIVWKDTKEIGIGVAWNDMERYWVINCFYYPPVQKGQFRENVFRPKCKV